MTSRIIAQARQLMRGPRICGQRDCLTDVLALLALQTGRAVPADLVPVYASPRAAFAWAARRGGIVAATDAVVRQAGMVAAATPAPGDLTVIDVAGHLLHAVWIGPQAVTRAENGPALVSGPCLGAWRWA